MKRKISMLLLISIFGYLNLQAQIPPGSKLKPKPKYETYEINDLDHHVAKPPRIRGNSMGTYIENQKYGVKVNDSIVSKPIYDKVKINSPYGFIVKKDGKYGFINRKAEEVIAIKYDSIGLFNGRSPTLLVKKGNSFGVISHQGKTILAIKHSKVLGCNNSLLCAVEDKKGNFQLYQNDKKVVKQNLDRIHFYENGVIIGANGKYGFVNESAKTEMIYDTITRVGYWNRQNNKKRTYSPYFNFGSRRLLERLVVEQNGQFGLIDFSGKTVVPIENDQIYYDERNQFYHITKGRKQGTYLIRCKKYIPPIYDRIRKDKGKLKVTKDGKVGIIDFQTGEFIFVPEYTDIEYLGNLRSDKIPGEFYKVKNGELHGIATVEKLIIPVEFEYIYPFEGMFQVIKAERRGLYNTKGEVIQPVEFDHILRPRTDRNAIIFTEKDNRYGFLDMEGKTLYEPVFKQRYLLPDTEQNLNLLRRGEKNFYQVLEHENGKFGVIDGFTGQFTLPLEYDGIYQKMYDAWNQKTYFLVSKDGKYGLVNEQNKAVIDLKYKHLDISLNDVLTSEEALANVSFVVEQNGKYGIIDLSDNVIVPFEYENIVKVSRTKPLFKAQKNGKYLFINHKNEVLNQGSFDDISIFDVHYYSEYRSGNRRFALAFKDGKMREIDENGQFLTKPIAMQPHDGFQSMETLKVALVDALNSLNDSTLYDFAKKIAPSAHLMYFFKESESKIRERTQYLDYDYVVDRYYKRLLRFKYSIWKSDYLNYDIANIYTEDFTVIENGLITNRRVDNWAYGNTKHLEKILRNSLKVNGYWISGYFVKSYF